VANITEELKQFVVANFLFGQGNGCLSEEASFLEKGIIDSTGVLELVAFLERQYAIRLADDEIVPENLDSLERLTRFVKRKLSAGAGEVGECK
jgi:acyl carrier protein